MNLLECDWLLPWHDVEYCMDENIGSKALRSKCTEKWKGAHSGDIVQL